MKIGDKKRFQKPGLRTPQLEITTILDGYQITEFRVKIGAARKVFKVRGLLITKAWQQVEAWVAKRL